MGHWLMAPLLLAQGLWVRHRTPRLPEAAGPREGHTGDGESLCLVALGDSIIAGVGVETTAQALPAQLADALARQLGRRVRWYSRGFNGARTQDLLSLALARHWRDADLVVISNGLNDVTGLARLDEFRQQKRKLFARLREWCPGALIVQAGIPPLGHFPALPRPLRGALGGRAEIFDRALKDLVEPLQDVIYLAFTDIPGPELFAADGYHPGPEAVRIWAERLAVEICGELAERRQGLGTRDG